MSRDPRVYLEDVLESIRRINTYVTGLDEVRLGDDQLRLDAVVRNLEIIGEAVKIINHQNHDFRSPTAAVESNP